MLSRSPHLYSSIGIPRYYFPRNVICNTMRELLIATTSKGKFAEIEAAFKDLPFKLLSLKDVFPEGIEIEEPGETFEGNAIIKAMTIGKRTGKLTLADDSGLEVDALNGEPGVKTARYAPGTDEDRYRKLLNVMKDVPDGQRRAKFRAVIALYDPEHGDKIRITKGELRGRITREPEGSGGFGYDPVFFNEEAGKMHAEESFDERSRTSHRGKALTKTKEILLKNSYEPTVSLDRNRCLGMQGWQTAALKASGREGWR